MTDKCICEGNFRKIVLEHEELIDRIFIADRVAYRYLGVLYSNDDYYHLMAGMDGRYRLLSCVGDLKTYGFELEE